MPVDLKVGPLDGYLYYASITTGRVMRIAFVPSGNRNPTAVASANPTGGVAPLNVAFSGSASSDPDNDTLTYQWNFGDGTPLQSGVSVNHTYNSAGGYVATLTVNDGRGGIDSHSVTINVGTPPVGNILSPANGTLYNAGQTINFSGNASDQQDGTLPASAFSWLVVFHHDTHTHPAFGPFNGVTSGTFTIPNQGETATNVWYRIHLTVTDSSGLSHQSYVDVVPRVVTLSLVSNIAGIQLTLDGQPAQAPFNFTSVAGMQRSIGAPSPQTISGTTYQFSSWSDGGGQTHTITSPASNFTYTANFQAVISTATPTASATRTATPTGTPTSTPSRTPTPTATPTRTPTSISTPTPTATPSSPASGSYTVFGDSEFIAGADFNGDGLVDLITSSYDDSSLSLLLNAGSNFAAASRIALQKRPDFVTTGRLNADNFEDLVVVSFDTNSVLTMLGNGNATFQSPVSHTVTSDSRAAVVADFNNDGARDLAIARSFVSFANSNDDYFQILLGVGNGSFGSPINVPIPGSETPTDLVAGDFNADGNIDIASIDFFTDNLKVRLGNGNATFGPPTTYFLGTFAGPVSVATADLNGDGRLDLMSPGFLNDRLIVLINSGNGSFQTPASYLAGSQVTSVAAGDFSGDGILDLVGANNGDATVSILTGRGDGTFNAQITRPADVIPHGIVVKNLHGDARTEVAVSHDGINIVKIIPP